jgi:hypothetical protein
MDTSLNTALKAFCIRKYGDGDNVDARFEEILEKMPRQKRRLGHQAQRVRNTLTQESRRESMIARMRSKLTQK